MKFEIGSAGTTMDRPATQDEIRAAIPVLDHLSDSRFEIVCEIPADSGGYVRISEEDLAAMAASEIDPAWTDYVEYWSHVMM